MAYALQCRNKPDFWDEMRRFSNMPKSLIAPKMIIKFVQYLDINTMICITVYVTIVKI